MKKINHALIFIAMIAICSAFVTKKNSTLPTTVKEYGFIEKRVINISGGPHDVILIDALNSEAKGVEYDCELEPGICTFFASDYYIQSGIVQTDYIDFFYASQVDPTLIPTLNSIVEYYDGVFIRF